MDYRIFDEVMNSKTKPSGDSQIYSRIDPKEIREITMKYENPFTPLYHLDKGRMNVLFMVLSDTWLFLDLYEKYVDGHREGKVKNRNDAMTKKLGEVKEYFESIGTNQTTIDDIEYAKKSLDNRHFTKRQIFENLLYYIAIVLNRKKNTQHVAKVTNELIEKYFGVNDIKFSKETKVENFKEFKYYYGNLIAPYTLYHS